MFLSAFPLADKAHRHIQIPSKDCLARPLSLPKIHNDGWRHLLDRGETLFIEMMHSHLIDDSCIMQVRHHLMHGCHGRTAVLLRHISHLHLLFFSSGVGFRTSIKALCFIAVASFSSLSFKTTLAES